MSQPINHVFSVGLALEMNSVYDRFKWDPSVIININSSDTLICIGLVRILIQTSEIFTVCQTCLITLVKFLAVFGVVYFKRLKIIYLNLVNR